MSKAEVDTFLNEERTCRLGSVDAAGRPHVSPMWFIWDGQSMWFNSIIGSQRSANLERNPVVSVVIDAGSEYMDLRGVVYDGRHASLQLTPDKMMSWDFRKTGRP